MSKPRYFFHNVYGDADNLLATLPSDVIPVPFGWDPETEQKRNSIIAQLNCTVSCLPSLVYWVNESSSIDRDGNTFTIPGHWKEFRFEFENQPWSWDSVPLSDS